jgi:hypothetical protein
MADTQCYMGVGRKRGRDGDEEEMGGMSTGWEQHQSVSPTRTQQI